MAIQRRARSPMSILTIGWLVLLGLYCISTKTYEPLIAGLWGVFLGYLWGKRKSPGLI